MRDSGRAGRWIRVSGDSQSESDQIPDINGYCDDRNYIKGELFEVHGKSAFKGAQDPDWLRVVDAFKAGEIDVIVCWMVDRLDRQNILHAIPMVLAVLDIGGRIEFSEQPECNLDAKSPNIDEQVKAFSDRIHAANAESKIKSKRITKKQRALRAAGSVVGRPPWGYAIVCRDYPECNGWTGGRKCGHIKIFAPTDEGRKYVPMIIQMIIDGKSLRTVAAWLTEQNVSTETGLPVWNEGYLGNRLIKNPVYYGERRNSGTLETEALVSYPVWAKANAALSSRVKTGRSAVVRDKAMLSPVCGNPDCDATGQHPSPMYRVQVGGKNHRTDYYRCTGKGPQRKGCGNMVPLDDLDARVMDSMLADHAPHYERVFIPGDDSSDKIGKLRNTAGDVYRLEGMSAKFMDLNAQIKALEDAQAEQSSSPRWEDKPAGQDESEYFASLDTDAQRTYLVQRWEISAYRDHGTEDEQVIVMIGRKDWR